jgi:hypothetical protein
LGSVCAFWLRLWVPLRLSPLQRHLLKVSHALQASQDGDREKHNRHHIPERPHVGLNVFAGHTSCNKRALFKNQKVPDPEEDYAGDDVAAN